MGTRRWGSRVLAATAGQLNAKGIVVEAKKVDIEQQPGARGLVSYDKSLGD